MAIEMQMTRRSFFRDMGGVALGGSAALLLKPKGVDAAMPWHGYTQAQRNSLIINRASQNLWQCVNYNCKEWAREVVASASGGVVYLPATDNNGIGWRWMPSQDVSGSSKAVENVNVGEIIQMNWKMNSFVPLTGGYWTPHTAIVYGKDSSGMTFIESNWSYPMSVSTRYVRFADFYSKVFIDYIYKYTVYSIL